VNELCKTVDYSLLKAVKNVIVLYPTTPLCPVVLEECKAKYPDGMGRHMVYGCPVIPY
jgi:hypothetical protein